MRLSIITFVVGALLIASPATMHGGSRSVLAATSASQSIQNARADAYHLSRMRNIAMIRRFHAAGLLVSVPWRTRFYYLHQIPAAYRYLRPWAKTFLDRLSREFYAACHQRLRVTSLVRTVALQRRLLRRNSNAADAMGAYRSSHLTGATLDISKHFMSPQGRIWMRRVLDRLAEEGYLYAVEEFEQPCFHVMVYPNYADYVSRLNRQPLEADSTN
jgi:hypothetical protein